LVKGFILDRRIGRQEGDGRKMEKGKAVLLYI